MAPTQRSDEMNLILWRHADAQNLPDQLVDAHQADMKRELTARGQQQAQRCAAWLRPRLPDGAVVLCSPARRAMQTAQALTDRFQVVRDLAPGADAVALLHAAGWPDSTTTVVIVGHQPTLGHVASLLLSNQEMAWSIKKSGIWWLASRRREEDSQVVLRAVINPDLL